MGVYVGLLISSTRWEQVSVCVCVGAGDTLLFIIEGLGIHSLRREMCTNAASPCGFSFWPR